MHRRRQRISRLKMRRWQFEINLPIDRRLAGRSMAVAQCFVQMTPQLIDLLFRAIFIALPPLQVVDVTARLHGEFGEVALLGLASAELS